MSILRLLTCGTFRNNTRKTRPAQTRPDRSKEPCLAWRWSTCDNMTYIIFYNQLDLGMPCRCHINFIITVQPCKISLAICTRENPPLVDAVMLIKAFQDQTACSGFTVQKYMDSVQGIMTQKKQRRQAVKQSSWQPSTHIVRDQCVTHRLCNPRIFMIINGTLTYRIHIDYPPFPTALSPHVETLLPMRVAK